MLTEKEQEFLTRMLNPTGYQNFSKAPSIGDMYVQNNKVYMFTGNNEWKEIDYNAPIYHSNPVSTLIKN